MPRLLDCLMVFGASIEPRPNGNYRLRMKRRFEHWRPMAWVLMVVESQDPEFGFLRFRLTQTDGCVLATTPDSRFLGETYEKWYRDGKRVDPDLDAMNSQENEIVRVFRLLGKHKIPASDKGWLRDRIPESVWG